MIKNIPIKTSGQNKVANFQEKFQEKEFQNLENLGSQNLNSTENLSKRNSKKTVLKDENSSQKTQKIILKIKNSNLKKPKVVIIGAGFSGLSSSCYLAKAGFEVMVVEKNTELGGRARVWEVESVKGKFRFDMGPSWYWMPRVFEDFFGDFGHQVSDFYELQKLPTQYRMFVKKDSSNWQKNELKNEQNEIENEKYKKQNNQFKEKKPNSKENLDWQNFVDLPSEYEEIKQLFEKIEIGSGKKLDEFVKHGEYTYNKGVREYMQKPSLSPLEFASFDFVSGVLRAGILQSFGRFVRQNFRNPIIRQMLEFPVLFLGATPAKTPKIYTLMAYTCLKEGTFYPTGGMGEIVNGMVKLAESLGVRFITNTEIVKIENEI